MEEVTKSEGEENVVSEARELVGVRLRIMLAILAVPDDTWEECKVRSGSSREARMAGLGGVKSATVVSSSIVS